MKAFLKVFYLLLLINWNTYNTIYIFCVNKIDKYFSKILHKKSRFERYLLLCKIYCADLARKQLVYNKPCYNKACYLQYVPPLTHLTLVFQSNPRQQQNNIQKNTKIRTNKNKAEKNTLWRIERNDVFLVVWTVGECAINAKLCEIGQ